MAVEQMGLGGDLAPPRSILHALPGPVLGIDPQTTRISVGILVPPVEHEGEVIVEPYIEARTLSLAQGGPHPGTRLWRAFAGLRPFFRDIEARFGRPVAVGLEQPVVIPPRNIGGRKVGMRVPERQYEMQGVLLAVLWDWLGEACAPDTVMPSTWKAAAMGKGNGFAKPPDYVAWAQRECGWVPGPEAPDDEAAALGVATWQALKVLNGT